MEHKSVLRNVEILRKLFFLKYMNLNDTNLKHLVIQGALISSKVDV